MKDLQDNIRNADILIVDDAPLNVALLESILSSAGYTSVTSQIDPLKVQDMCRQREFDLILLDIQMPYLDGFEVMRQLIELAGDDYLPILVLTASTDRATRLRALESGAKDYLTKPFERLEVLHRIRNLLVVRAQYKERKLQSERLEEMVRDRTRELEDTRLEIIHRLSRAGEYRDNETGMHVIRMSKSCEQLALAAGLGKAFGELILYASPMHDVGKIGIPDRVLLKPGPLDPDEWALMQRHVEIGLSILGTHTQGLLAMATNIVKHHHERWDGTGYPNRLKGEDIPIEGRIAAICDVFDALTSKRPYKEPWPVFEAVEYLRKNAGSHFDPVLVDYFVAILPEILEIRLRHADDGV
ncbi:MAG: HD domain-containing phosphohydrolase [Rhodospirillaceae bacterium]